MHIQPPAPCPPPLPAARGNVYMRCANDGRGDLAGHLFVALGTPGLPCWPDMLQALPAPIGMPQGQHPPGLRTVQALTEFFRHNPGYAQRSVAFGIGDAYRFQAHYQQREAGAEMHLEVRAHGCHPAWSISVLGEDPDGPLQIAPFVLHNGHAWVSVARQVPADYDDILTLLIDTHGHPAPLGARVDLVVSVKLPMLADDGSVQPTLFRLGCHSWRGCRPSEDRAAHV